MLPNSMYLLGRTIRIYRGLFPHAYRANLTNRGDGIYILASFGICDDRKFSIWSHRSSAGGVFGKDLLRCTRRLWGSIRKYAVLAHWSSAPIQRVSANYRVYVTRNRIGAMWPYQVARGGMNGAGSQYKAYEHYCQG